jgi:oxygen-independent coproporphyrinogen-3 oxidase
LLTGLRTQWGCTWERISQIIPQKELTKEQKHIFENYVAQSLLESSSIGFRLTTQGKFFADQIASDLFLV